MRCFTCVLNFSHVLDTNLLEKNARKFLKKREIYVNSFMTQKCAVVR